MVPLALVALLATDVAGYIVEVPASGEQCFTEAVKRGDKVLGSFSVGSGGNLDIDLKVYFGNMHAL